MTKTMIIAIVGASGSGKTTLSMYLEAEAGIKPICSYTTRPMRSGEVNGREHWFVDSTRPIPEKPLAYTFFGGHHYWTEIDQLKNQTVCSYVVDERGLKELKAKSGEDYDVVSVYVRRPDTTGIDPCRIERDADREVLSQDEYDIVLTNVGPLDFFLKNSLSIINWYFINSAKDGSK